MKAAILLIDLLEDYFQDGRLKANRSTLVSHINALTSVGRASHLPIIWVRQAFKADLSDAFVWMRKTQTAVTIENTPGSQLLNDLERAPTDLEVVKKRYSAFFRTNLDELLQTLAADLLIIGGINTHACVRMAVIDAYQRDYEVVLALDCTDSYDEEHHHVSLRYLTRGICTSKTNQELFDLLTSNPSLFFGDSGGLEAHDTQARSVG
jgi:nicotinamidase-related amidase